MDNIRSKGYQMRKHMSIKTNINKLNPLFTEPSNTSTQNALSFTNLKTTITPNKSITLTDMFKDIYSSRSGQAISLLKETNTIIKNYNKFSKPKQKKLLLQNHQSKFNGDDSKDLERSMKISKVKNYIIDASQSQSTLTILKNNETLPNFQNSKMKSNKKLILNEANSDYFIEKTQLEKNNDEKSKFASKANSKRNSILNEHINISKATKSHLNKSSIDSNKSLSFPFVILLVVNKYSKPLIIIF